MKIRSLDGEQGPYQNVFLQEMDVMNTLLAEIVRSLKELLLGTSRFQRHLNDVIVLMMIRMVVLDSEKCGVHCFGRYALLRTVKP